MIRSVRSTSRRNRARSGLLLAVTVAGVSPLAAEAPAELDTVTVNAPRVANQEPAGALATPVSLLRYEPLADVQSRQSAEGQADVALRGGIFENTAFTLGGITVFDPQTGHYTAELPVPPSMLQSPRVLTGFEHAASSFNALAGSVAYEWAPIRTRGRASVAGGAYGFNRQQVYQGYVSKPKSGWTLGADVDVARSAASGPDLEDLDFVLGPTPAGATRTAGNVAEHEFNRVAARVRLEGPSSSSQVFYGYQNKDFNWPNLYTPFRWPESENLQSHLIATQHRQQFGENANLQWDAYYRRNRDDYEADTRLPGRFNPYQHETEVTATSLSGSVRAAGIDWKGRVLALADSIDSTSLEPTSPGSLGDFASRSLWQAAFTPEKRFELEGGSSLTASAGAVFDDSNRDEDGWSPLARLAWGRDTFELYGSYAGATQVAGYTALNSSPASGLFRGNPDLGRADSGTWEAGASWGSGGWQARGAVFLRRDRGLTDWVIVDNPALTPAQLRTVGRFAQAIDVDTLGAEAVVRRSWKSADLIAGYTWLEKDYDYPNATTGVFGSYYGLNFPKHRATLAAIVRPLAELELRLDNEFRIQEANPLRTTSGHAFVSSIGVRYAPHWCAGLEFEATVDNVWDENFQEIPSMPATPRTWSAGLAYAW